MNIKINEIYPTIEKLIYFTENNDLIKKVFDLKDHLSDNNEKKLKKILFN